MLFVHGNVRDLALQWMIYLLYAFFSMDVKSSSPLSHETHDPYIYIYIYVIVYEHKILETDVI